MVLKKPLLGPCISGDSSLEMLTVKPEVTILQNALHKNWVGDPCCLGFRLSKLGNIFVFFSLLFQGGFPALPLTGPWLLVFGKLVVGNSITQWR